MQSLIESLTELMTTSGIQERNLLPLEKYLSELYYPNSPMPSVGELRWILFTKKRLVTEKLSLSILHAHYQAIIWKEDCT